MGLVQDVESRVAEWAVLLGSCGLEVRSHFMEDWVRKWTKGEGGRAWPKDQEVGFQGEGKQSVGIPGPG